MVRAAAAAISGARMRWRAAASGRARRFSPAAGRGRAVLQALEASSTSQPRLRYLTKVAAARQLGLRRSGTRLGPPDLVRMPQAALGPGGIALAASLRQSVQQVGTVSQPADDQVDD